MVSAQVPVSLDSLHKDSVSASVVFTDSIGADSSHLACTLTLTGSITEADAARPASGAYVILEGTNRGAATDSTGHYAFDTLCQGRYTLMVSQAGMLPSRREVELKSADSVDFILSPQPKTVEKSMVVKVQGRRPPKSLTQTQSVLSGAELDKTRGKSLGDALKSVNGVTSLQSGASIVKPVINGLHSNRILIMNNGVRQEGQQWGSEHAPEIDPFLATQITVIKGAAGVRYGSDAIGGVVLLEPPPIRSKPGIGGEVNLVAYSNNHQGVGSATMEGSPASVPGLGWRIQGTAKKAGETKAPDYYINNTGMEEYNYSGALGYQKEGRGLDLFYSQFYTKLGIASASSVGSITDLKYALERKTPRVDRPFYWDSTYQIAFPYQSVDHKLFKVRAFSKTGTSGNLAATYAIQNDDREEFDFRFDRRPIPSQLFNITTQSAELVWDHNAFHGFKGSAGVSGIYQGNYYKYRDFIPNFRDYGGGAFGTESWTGGKLQLEAGARYDYRWRQIFKNVPVYESRNVNGADSLVPSGRSIVASPDFQYQSVSEMLGSAYAFTPELKAKINLSSAWRPPGVNELFGHGIHQSAAAIEKGDSTLDAERSYNLTGEVEYHYKKRLSLELSGYCNFIRDFIYLQLDTQATQTFGAAWLTFDYRQTDGVVAGAEISGDLQITDHWSYKGRASLLRGYNHKTGAYLPWMSSDRFENGLTYTFPAWKRLTNAYVGANLQSVLKQTRSPSENILVNVPPGTDPAGAPTPEKTDTIAIPTPGAYTLLHLDAGLSLAVAGRPVDFELGANNILNESYREYTDRFRYYVDEMGWNVFLRMKMPFEFPSLGTK
jgi:iron complex outermembrane recepter protein